MIVWQLTMKAVPWFPLASFDFTGYATRRGSVLLELWCSILRGPSRATHSISEFRPRSLEFSSRVNLIAFLVDGVPLDLDCCNEGIPCVLNKGLTDQWLLHF